MKKNSSKFRFLADLLSITRGIAGLPVSLALTFDKLVLAWIIIFLAGISDLADGWLARKSGGGTKFGALIDPLSDKILMLAPIMWLVSQKVIPIWAAWILFTREFVISGWRSDDPQGGPASLSGKAKTSIQYLSILLMLWPNEWASITYPIDVHKVGLILFWPSLFLAISSALKYLKV